MTRVKGSSDPGSDLSVWGRNQIPQDVWVLGWVIFHDARDCFVPVKGESYSATYKRAANIRGFVFKGEKDKPLFSRQEAILDE